ncbi:hypothetical protein [Afifella sp. YEN Y35]|uniref:hypothetical protein n=1 Tax=Afifella sp. YEN Y35 TaxID=3388337 RepID=UPI0039DFE9AF
MTTTGTIAGVGGRVAGGVLGGAIGSVFGPVGLWIGRAVGSRVGGMAAKAAAEALASYMEEANDDAETQTKDDAQEQPCKDCEQECRDLEKQMNDEMYANKRGPGGRGKHGLALRRAEQICGPYGPGETKMDSVVKGGRHILKESKPWETHATEIRNQQAKLRELRDKYNKLGCPKLSDSKSNMSSVNRMLDPKFNPTPDEWLGPDHPSCQGLKDLIRNNATPELPEFRFPGSGRQGGGGVPVS